MQYCKLTNNKNHSILYYGRGVTRKSTENAIILGNKIITKRFLSSPTTPPTVEQMKRKLTNSHLICDEFFPLLNESPRNEKISFFEHLKYQSIQVSSNNKEKKSKINNNFKKT